MNWFKRFVKTNKGDSGDPSASQPDRVANLANELGGSGRLAEVEQGLLALKHEKLSAKEQVSWHVLWIASAFRRGDRSEAFGRALAAVHALPNEPEIAFALGQEHEFRGEVDEMIRCFRNAPFPKVSAAHALVATRYCYLRGRFAEALEFVSPIVEAHFTLKIADDTFLYIRRMPFATTTFATAVCLNLLNSNPSAAKLLLQRASNELADGSVSHLEPLLTACQYADPEIAVAALESRASQYASAGPLGGFGGIQLATWRSRTLKAHSDVKKLFEQVTIGEDNHQWLHDVRTLALAEAAHRFGDVGEEARFIQTLIAKQPLLLEPEWALSFGFIDYLERVRSEFWPAATGRKL